MRPANIFIAAVAASLARHGKAASTIDLSWYAPNATSINDLSQVISGTGVYGFIYNSSATPAEEYGIYNSCNMPHVRATEYKKPSSEYKLQYVEVVSGLDPNSKRLNDSDSRRSNILNDWDSNASNILNESENGPWLTVADPQTS